MDQFVPANPRGVARLVGCAAEFYRQEGMPLDAGVVRQALAELVADAALARVWVLLVDGEPVGYLALPFCYSIEYGGRDAFLDEVFAAGLVDHGRRSAGRRRRPGPAGRWQRARDGGWPALLGTDRAVYDPLRGGRGAHARAPAVVLAARPAGPRPAPWRSGWPVAWVPGSWGSSR
jgi:hypothetical protein